MKTPNGPIEKIKTIDEFDRIQKGNRGYIVVTDSASPNIVHRPTCPQINTRFFKLKVIDNACKDGQYFWVSDIDLGIKVFNAFECLVCLR